MSAVSGRPSDCRLYGVIHYLYILGISAHEIHDRLCTMYGENNVYQIHPVYYWVEQFAKGRTNLQDGERSGEPSDVLNVGSIGRG